MVIKMLVVIYINERSGIENRVFFFEMEGKDKRMCDRLQRRSRDCGNVKWVYLLRMIEKIESMKRWCGILLS